jgi:hypothetical protein
MDSSKLLEQRVQCMEKYKSSWKPRDASEITLQKHHQLTHCCNYHKRTFPIVNTPLPYAPIIQSIQPDNESLIVFFLPPPSFTNCGCVPPIVNYEYSINGIDYISTNTTTSPITIRGLTNGTTYSITLRADNSAGQGPPSNSVQGTPYAGTRGVAEWATQLNILGSNPTIGYSVQKDSLNNIYTTGSYYSTSTVNLYNMDGTQTLFTLPNTNISGTFTNAMYLIKYDTSGQVQWATYLSGTSSIIGYSLATDASNNVYITGTYANSSGTLTVQNANGSASNIILPNTTSAVFLIKYNSSGQAIWATILNGTSVDVGYSLAVDANNLYISGYYNNTLADPSGVIVYNSVSLGSADSSPSNVRLKGTSNTFAAFLIKYDLSGQAIWATNLITNSTIGYTITVDLSSNIYFSGLYTQTSGIATVQDVSGNGQTNSLLTLPITGSNGAVFLIKYNPSGQAIWATIFNGSGSDIGFSLTIDSTNNVYITGQYTSSDASGNLIVYNGVNTGSANASSSSIRLPPTSTTGSISASFLIKYDSSGQAQWATYLNGTSNDIGYSLAIDSSNNVYITGQYTSSDASGNVIIYNGSNSSLPLPSSYTLPPTSSRSNMFLIKYDPSGQTQWATCINPTYNILSFGRSIIIDTFNTIYITGSCISYYPIFYDASGTSQSSSTVSIPVYNFTGSYLAKYDSNGIAQSVAYLNGFGQDLSNSACQCRSIITDSANNVYITGQYQSNQPIYLYEFNGSSQVLSLFTLPFTSSNALFLIKYNSSGKIQWATYLNGTGSDIGFSLAIDQSNNIYITGQYINTSGTLIVQDASGYSQTPTNITLPNYGSTSAVFLIKYNSSGQAQWATVFNGSSADIGYSLITDISNNVYVSGQYIQATASGNVIVYNGVSSGSADASGSNIRLPPTSSLGNTPAMFLIKYDSSGQAQWATYLNGTGSDAGYSLVSDSTNNIYITGQYNSTDAGNVIVYNSTSSTTLPAPSGITLPSISSSIAVFLIKYDSSGQVIWATYFNGTGFDAGYSLARDSTNNIYITGNYSSSDASGNVIVYNRTTSTTPPQASGIVLPSTSSNFAVFLIKYDASGTAQWATYLNGNGTDIGYSLVRDSTNNIYITGQYNSSDPSGNVIVYNRTTSTTPPPSSGITLPPTSSQTTMFFIKYDASGIAQWATYLKGTRSTIGYSVAIDSSNKIYVGGTFYSPTQLSLQDVSGNTQTASSLSLFPTPISSSGSGAFLIKYS